MPDSPISGAPQGSPRQPGNENGSDGSERTVGDAAARRPGPPRRPAKAGHADLRQQLESADRLREAGQFEAAEAAYTHAHERAPRNLRALLGLGFTARLRRDPEAALTWFRYAAHANPDANNVNPLLYIADTLRELGRLDASDRNYRTALERAPGGVRALMGLGINARHRKDNAAAAALFREAAEANQDPANLAPELNLADTLRELGRPEEAEAVCRAVVERVPNHPRALAGMGQSARSRKDHRAALDWYRRAAAANADRNNSNPDIEVANSLRDLGRLDAADAAYRAVLGRAPGHPRALVGIAVNARLRGARAEALDWLREAVAADPDNLTATLELATELRDLDRFDDATALAEEARRRHADDHRPWISLAQTRRRAGDHEGAHRILVAARAAHPEEPALALEQALEEQWLGRPHAAEALLRQVLERDPGNLAALASLTQNASAAGTLDHTLVLLDAARARQPANAQLCGPRRAGVVGRRPA